VEAARRGRKVSASPRAARREPDVRPSARAGVADRRDSR
jgi:hypothetical protein